MGYSLLRNGIYWGYSPLTNLLLTTSDIQVAELMGRFVLLRFIWKIPSGEDVRFVWPTKDDLSTSMNPQP